jgi:hypothetical protein
MSLMLQSCLGGSVTDFNVIWQQHWCFQFSVSCKNVGIMIHNLKSFTGKFFSIHFTL